jgi:TorA maturation chaperone TorD
MSETAPTSTRFLAQADLVLLVAELFRPPRSPATRLEACDAAAVTELMLAAGFADDRDVSAALHATRREAQALPRASWSAEYHRLFEAAMLCPPNETAYVRRDKGAIIGDIVAFYRAFGIAPHVQSGEKPDHIVAEMEFVAVLLTMAAATSDPEQEQVAREALEKFAEAHLADWVLLLADRLGSVTTQPLFRCAADLLKATWHALAATHGLSLAATGAVVPDCEPESPYECGMTPTLPARDDERLVQLHVNGQR